MFFGTLGASLLGNNLAGKEMDRIGEVFYQSRLQIFNQKQGFLIPPHSLTNFEIQKYYQNEPRFNGVYSRSNLPDKIKDGYM